MLWPAARQLSRFSDPFHAALFSAESRGALEDEEGRAAREGAAATAAMHPRAGRAAYLGERALGHLDAGAVAVTVWLAAIAPD